MKNKRLIAFLIVILAVGVIGVAAGVSVAYWTEASTVTGHAPQAYSYDYGVWSKYVTWTPTAVGWTLDDGVWTYTGSNGSVPSTFEAAITGFKDYLGEDVVFPTTVTAQVKMSAEGSAESKTFTFTDIRSSVFADVSLKAMPTQIVIPPGMKVDASAFSGLTNLKDVIFDGTNVTTLTEIGAYAFSGCTSLRSVTFAHGVNGNNYPLFCSVSFGEKAFLGCNSFVTISSGDNVVVSYGNAITALTGRTMSGNWNNFKTYVGITNNVTVA